MKENKISIKDNRTNITMDTESSQNVPEIETTGKVELVKEETPVFTASVSPEISEAERSKLKAILREEIKAENKEAEVKKLQEQRINTLEAQIETLMASKEEVKEVSLENESADKVVFNGKTFIQEMSTEQVQTEQRNINLTQGSTQHANVEGGTPEGNAYLDKVNSILDSVKLGEKTSLANMQALLNTDFEKKMEFSSKDGDIYDPSKLRSTYQRREMEFNIGDLIEKARKSFSNTKIIDTIIKGK